MMEQGALAPETPEADAAARHQAAALLWANAPVIAGVAFLGWRIHEVMYLYWLDCMVLGLFTFLRVLRCEPERPQATAPAAVMFLLVYTGLLLFFELFVRNSSRRPGWTSFTRTWRRSWRPSSASREYSWGSWRWWSRTASRSSPTCLPGSSASRSRGTRRPKPACGSR